MRASECSGERASNPDHDVLAARADLAPEANRSARVGISRILVASDAGDLQLQRACTLRFESVLVREPARDLATVDALDPVAIAALAGRARARGLRLLLDVDMHRIGSRWTLAQSHPAWFRQCLQPQWPIDPRREWQAGGYLLPRFDAARVEVLTEAYVDALARAAAAGAAGFVLHWPQRIPGAVLQQLLEAVRKEQPEVCCIAWAQGLSREQRRVVAASGVDASVCSLPWWDFRAPWFAEELDDLRERGGAVIAPVNAGADSARRFETAREFAAAVCDGWLLDSCAMTESGASSSAEAHIAATNRSLAGRAPRQHPLRCVSAPWARVQVWSDDARVTLVNSDLEHHASVPAVVVERAAQAALEADAFVLGPGEVRTVALPSVPVVAVPPPADALKKALGATRVVIEGVSPDVDDGRFPAKCVLGEQVVVEADVFSDGHPVLSVRLLWRAADAADWNPVRMRSLGNDRWRGEFCAQRLGLHLFTIHAGIDEFGGVRSDLEKKLAAGQPVDVEIAEAAALIEGAVRHAPAALRKPLREFAQELIAAPDKATRLLASDCADLMARARAPAFPAKPARTYAVAAERPAAQFASWYEMFPRSAGADGGHGTLREVIEQLPRIAALGFDVLYFPPIHPIGTTHRKGRNNNLRAGTDEPGSPYAIGAKAGGHDAVHPQLGTLEDFRALVAAARAHGIEIALDFAVQCSPDHPWIKAHPEWFAWRPDGTLRHAENPPKKYEDIVNVDFYAEGKAELWCALRDIVAFWVGQGVKTFRVDNPHTKPLPFWEWLIAQLRALDPDVIFLSEAFTRPRMMYRLAKLGFSQSYTYFTWRTTRAELESYLGELNAAPVRDFFRPHFFVNTPDINPAFLQASGRPGFLIRAALAATLSGLWGMYSGFELCEAAALPGREEYLDSEKYQLRPRDWNAPGNINAEVAQLNRIRKVNPALHSHRGVTFYNCDNSNILYFGKSTPARDNVLLVAICLDPSTPQEAAIELPLWEWNLDDSGLLLTEDLLTGRSFDWRGKRQHLRIDPASGPYRIWRVRPERER